MKRIKNLIKCFMIFAFLFGGLAVVLSPAKVYAAEGTICDPIEIRVCSICGNDYDNSELCPHHIGDMYHGDICTPTPGRICSICGGNYDDGTICPHHEGDEYGGEVCTPVRICDICGGNYDDGNECPHHEGEAYGGEVCTVELVEICNICGNDYHDGSVCSHLKDNYYDDEWCEPEDTRICSICGGNYDDGNVCPHHEGEIYGQQVCTITRICNLCGGNYDDGSECPHHEGEYYGEECSVYNGRLCSICGYNYDDGNVCPHKTGQMYNGDVCEVNEMRMCNICGQNYDDPSMCPHKIGEVYGRSVSLKKWYEEKLAYCQSVYDDVNGVYDWNEDNNTAAILMMANKYGAYAEFVCGVDGTYINVIDKQIYVKESLLWQAFGYIIDPPVVIDTVRDTAVIATTIVLAVKAPAIVNGIKTYIVPLVSGAGVQSYSKMEYGINFSAKPLEHMQDPDRFVPVSILMDAIKYGEAKPDPRNSRAIMYTIEMSRNGKVHTLEVLYDELTNTIWHFLYR